MCYFYAVLAWIERSLITCQSPSKSTDRLNIFFKERREEMREKERVQAAFAARALGILSPSTWEGKMWRAILCSIIRIDGAKLLLYMYIYIYKRN